jgi:hypothetical protein
MSQAILRSISTVLVLCCAVLFAPSVDAQSSFRDSLIDAQALIRGGMRQVVEAELVLAEEQEEKFWGVYGKYTADLMKIEAEYIVVIGEFVDRSQAGTLTNDEADRLLDSSLEIQMDKLQIRQRYVRYFRKILTGMQVVRLYQLESKVQAEVNAAMAIAIPLVEPE